MRNKKGFVWISAVLYIALGVLAISLVLSAGLPLINKMKDRNTILQTKDILYTIDKNIGWVSGEGIGSKRFLDPLIIKDGKLVILDNTFTGAGSSNLYGRNKIIWEMKTNAKIMEACEPDVIDKTICTQSEGNVKIYSYLTKVKDEYLISIVLDYSNQGIVLTTAPGYTTGSALLGKYSLSIKNIGSVAVNDVRKGNIELEIR